MEAYISYISVNGDHKYNDDLGNLTTKGYYGYSTLQGAIDSCMPIYNDTQYCKMELSGDIVIDGDIVYGVSMSCLHALTIEGASDICGEIIKVKESHNSNKYNYVKKGKLLSKIWFDDCDGKFSSGYATVLLNGKYNWISANGNLLFTEWFDKCHAFNDGVALVEANGKWNYVKTDKSFLIRNWVDDAFEFNNGFGLVVLGGIHYFIDTNGLMATDRCFDKAFSFLNGVAIVELNGKWNLLDERCKYMFDEWLDDARYIQKDAILVERKCKYNYIINKKLLCNDWLDEAHRFICGFAKVKLNGKFNYVNRDNGEYLSDTWFDKASGFSEGFASVKLDNYYNLISANGTYIKDNAWFDKAGGFDNGVAKVKYNNYVYHIDHNGDEVRWNGKVGKLVKTGRNIYEIGPKETGVYTYELIGNEVNNKIIFPINVPLYTELPSNSIVMNKITGEMFALNEPYVHEKTGLNGIDVKDVRIHISLKVSDD